MENSIDEIHMIEFFSGIGGMRYAIEDAFKHQQDNIRMDDGDEDNGDDNGTTTIKGDEEGSKKEKKTKRLASCTAYEISLYANQTYSLNFKEPISSFKEDKRCNNQRTSSINTTTSSRISKPFAIYTKLIEQLKPQDVHNTTIWTMSPPCQPFTNTRHAKQRDSSDERCKGFKAIIQLLRNITDLNKRPKWILLENVKGFHGSDMLQQWYDCLNECGYTFEEYMLNPTQFGIPNNRMRYYMVAERSDRFGSDTGLRRECRTSLPSNNDCGTITTSDSEDVIIRSLSNYIQKLDEKERVQYLIPEQVFESAWAKDIPIVCPLDRVTHCFTAGYGRQIHRSTGSLLLFNNNNDDDDENHRNKPVADDPIDRTDMTIYKGKLRRFTEKELATLFGFPPSFVFPDELSLDHRYKLIGNSVNVKVISSLLQYLLL